MTTVRPRLRDYDYQQLVRGTSAKTLTARRPKAVLQTLLIELRKLTESDRDGLSSFARSAIEDTDQDVFERPLNSLVDAIRDALLVLADLEDEDLPERLQQWLRETHPIYRRLSLHILTERPEYIGVMPQELVLPAEIYDHDAYHEQARLLNERFAELPAELQRRVHDYLDSCIGGSAESDDVRPGRRAWRLLNVLPDAALTNGEREFKEAKIRELGGVMEQPLFEVWTSGVHAVTAPATCDELRVLFDDGGHERLLDALRNPTKYFTIEWLQDAELLWDEVRALVREDPAKHLQLGELLAVDDFPDAWCYFDAYEQLAKEGTEFDWRPLLTAINQLTGASDASPVYWSAAHIMKSAATSTTNPVTPDDLDLLGDVVERILAATCVPIHSRDQIERDLLTHQLNAPAGAAADALISICFRRAYDASGEEERASNLPESPRMDQRSREVLSKAVSEGWGGIELRHSIGQMLWRILWADASWLAKHVNTLLPIELDDPAHAGAWRGFWAGHLRTDRLYEPVMERLFERYEVLVEDAIRQEPVVLMDAFSGHDRDPLGEHLRIAWLRGYEGFGQEGLFNKFYEGISEEGRANVVRALVPDLRHASTTDDGAWGTRVLSELYGFWDRRLHIAKTQRAGERSKEISAFCFWLRELREGPDVMEERLKAMLTLVEGGFECDLVLDYLAANVKLASGSVARLLPLVVEGVPEGPEGSWHAEKIPPVIETTWSLVEDSESRTALVKAASRLLERFGIDIREKLGL